MAEELWWVEHISIDRKGQKVPTFWRRGNVYTQN